MSFCLIILNCKKYFFKRSIQYSTWLHNFTTMPYFHVVGDTSILTDYIFDEVNHLLTVNAPDDYLSLPKKTYMAIKAIRKHFPHIQHVLKTDDDVVCNITELHKTLEQIVSYDYGGYLRDIHVNLWSQHHYHSSDDRNEKLVLACVYCSGPFYFLSQRAMDCILSRKEDFWTYVYEDNVVGYALKYLPDLKLLSLPNESVFKQVNQTLPIVSVNIMGGLGNQLFQACSAYAYARKMNVPFLLEKKVTNDKRPLYFDTVLRNFQPFLVSQLPPHLETWNEHSATKYTDIGPLHLPGKYLTGYLQSSKYFQNDTIQQEMKALLKPVEKDSQALQMKYSYLLANAERVVVVHSRQTDYVTFSSFHGPLQGEYYTEAIKRILERIPNPIFLFCGDDNQFWNTISDSISEAYKHEWYVLSNETDIVTFYLLQRFQNFIMSNSTFIWWCVWLSNAKTVFVPKKWFGPTGPSEYEDIYEPSWIRIDSV